MQAAVPATLLLAGLQSDSEEAFKIKGFVRQIGARTRKVLVEAIGKALDTVTAKMRAASSFIAVTVFWCNSCEIPYSLRRSAFSQHYSGAGLTWLSFSVIVVF